MFANKLVSGVMFVNKDVRFGGGKAIRGPSVSVLFISRVCLLFGDNSGANHGTNIFLYYTTHYASISRLNIMDTKVQQHCTITGVHRTGVKAGGKGRFRKIPRFYLKYHRFQ